MLTLSMSAFRGEADVLLINSPMSANDPKRTSRRRLVTQAYLRRGVEAGVGSVSSNHHKV